MKEDKLKGNSIWKRERERGREKERVRDVEALLSQFSSI
jgi:hypothetical protein